MAGLQKTTTPQGGRNKNRQNKQSHTKRNPLGWAAVNVGQHPCPQKKRRAGKKGPAQHEFYIDVSGDSRDQWSDETQQLIYVLATWEDP
ncbi:hypothetical protein TNCV_2630971 [Trichonephila clavipes]|nr:hypothetical protein TNCV_2630971 [Trichonephila clavipes]